MNAHVYRVYDGDGRLIYVGCTGNLIQRLRYHHLLNSVPEHSAEPAASQESAQAEPAQSLTSTGTPPKRQLLSVRRGHGNGAPA